MTATKRPANLMNDQEMWAAAEHHMSIQRRANAILAIASEVVDAAMSDLLASVLLVAVCDTARPPRIGEIVEALTLAGRFSTHGADFAYSAPGWTLIEQADSFDGAETDFDQYATQLDAAWRARARRLAVTIATEATS
jgi:hypothetical protein